MHRSLGAHVKTGTTFSMQAVLTLVAVTWLRLCVSVLALCGAGAMICVQLVEWRVSAKARPGRVMVVSPSPGLASEWD
jgi:hypothetical protein